MLRQAAGFATVLVLAAACPASADLWGNVECGVGSAACDLSAAMEQHQGQVIGRPGEVGYSDEIDPAQAACRYVPVKKEPPGGDAGDGDWFMVRCSPDGKDPLSHGPVWVKKDEVPTFSPAELADTARSRLQLPSVVIAASPVGDQLVHLPTWLWLSSGWSEVSATASVPGVSVAATAKPISVSWSMGDGSTVTCAGAGTPYTAGADPRATSPDCGHVYHRSSAGQPEEEFPVTVTVRWVVTWSGAGQGGTFPDMTTTGGTSFRVVESQALNNGG
ncbi:hypothetical protein [Saccharothrix obliqua]|uniref:hypothetical protein n=1 Tax=Saccharothrix obliqua TaxID=2861747 RepID=UPI002151A9F0|nr:hypothetical protein [Saccharothrix obliqua]